MKQVFAIAALIALIILVAFIAITKTVEADKPGSCTHEHWHDNHGPFSHWNVSGSFDVPGRLVGAATDAAYQKYTDKTGWVWKAEWNLWVKYETRTIQTVQRVNQSTGTNTIAEVRAKYPVAAGYTVWAIRSYGGDHAWDDNQHRDNGLTHSVGHIDEDKHGNHQHCWK